MEGFLVRNSSDIDGIGIFTDRNIEKGEVFYKVPVGSVFNEPKSKCAHIGNNTWVPDGLVLNYINHSCDPNAILDISGEPKLVAKKDIEFAEEITVDYNLTEINGTKVPCTCQSKNCRKYFLRIE